MYFMLVWYRSSSLLKCWCCICYYSCESSGSSCLCCYCECCLYWCHSCCYINHADLLSDITHAPIYEFRFCVINLSINYPFAPNTARDKYVYNINYLE